MRSNLDVFPLQRKRTKIVEEVESMGTRNSRKRIQLPPIVSKLENTLQK